MGFDLEQFRRGRKESHWMWFVFPQIAGLGSSPMARRYAIASGEEARAYLAHPLLGPRLGQCVEAVLGHRGRSAETIDAFHDGERDEATLGLLRA